MLCGKLRLQRLSVRCSHEYYLYRLRLECGGKQSATPLLAHSRQKFPLTPNAVKNFEKNARTIDFFIPEVFNLFDWLGNTVVLV